MTDEKLVQKVQSTSHLIPEALTGTVGNKFRRMVKLFELVGKGVLSGGALISGEPGVGKSYYCLKTLDSLGFVHGKDFVVSRGHTTPLGLYELLYLNRSKLLVLDDCDSLLQQPSCISILKVAGEESPTRQISYLSSRLPPDLPKDFLYDGRIIFMTNHKFENDRNRDRKAVESRWHHQSMTLSYSEKIEAIEKLLVPTPHKNSTLSQRIKAFDVLRVASENAPDALTFRTFKQILDLLLHDEGELSLHLDEIFPVNFELSTLLRVLTKYPKTEDACSEYMRVMSCSRRTFFYARKKHSRHL